MNDNSGQFRSVPQFPVSGAHKSDASTLFLRTAKLLAGGGEYPCVIRQAGAAGLTVKTFHPLPPDDAMVIEMGGGGRYHVMRLTEGQGRATFRFADRGDETRLVEEDRGSLRKRPIRLRFAMHGSLHAGGEVAPMQLRDISQQGAAIVCAIHLAIAEQVRLECPPLPAIIAKVRWRREPLYGLVLERTFRFDELARLTGPLQGTAQTATIVMPGASLSVRHAAFRGSSL